MCGSFSEIRSSRAAHISSENESTFRRIKKTQIPAKRKIRWFMNNNSRVYESISFCQEHGYVKGKIRIRKTDEGGYYAVKTIKNVDEEKAEEIREKRDSLRRKRRMHSAGASQEKI